jgi:cyclophilin family peptidyl-prolyl cis-trans isomerase
MTKVHILIITSLLLLGSCRKKSESYTINRFEDPKQLQIAKLQDEKDGRSLKKFLNAKKESHRYRASLAFASVKDTNAIPYLSLRVQTDRSARVRAAAGYALGQIGHDKASPALIEGIGIEFDLPIRAVFIEALGKIPTKANLDLLLSLKPRDTITEAGIMAGLFQLTLRKVLDSRVYDKAIHALEKGPENTFSYAAQIIARGVYNTNSSADTLDRWWSIFEKLNSLDAKIPMARASGNFEFDSSQTKERYLHQAQIISHLLIEKNPIVRANLVAALSKSGNIDPRVSVTENVHELIKEVHPQVLSVITEQLIPNNKALARYWCEKEVFFKGTEQYYKLLQLYMAANGAYSISNAMTNAKLQHDFFEYNNSYLALPIIEALSADAANFNFIHENTKNSEYLFVRTAGLLAINEMIEKMDCKCPEVRLSYSKEVLPYALRSEDVGMISAACYGADNSEFPELIIPILDSLTRHMILPLEMESFIDVKKALARLKQDTFIKPKPVYAHPVNWNQVLLIKDTTQVIIQTNKGQITLQCLVNEAPGSVWNFLQLVDSGYYNGKSFHRLVAGFVIQGGCDRGDGWGSPRWSQRAEFSNFLSYKAGSVGIASVGPDTEGYQFFITHCATPNLTGRYTIFAEVVQGMDVVQLLDVGDRIKSVKRL